MTDKTEKTGKPTKAGAVVLTEQELDQALGASDDKLAPRSQPRRSKATTSTAVGVHEITGALIKIN